MTPQREPQGHAAKDSSQRSGLSSVRIPGTKLEGVRAIVFLAIGLYVVLFIALNGKRVEVNFVFFKFRTHELLGFLLVLALGFIAGYIVRGRRLSRNHGTAAAEHARSGDVQARPALPPGGTTFESDVSAAEESGPAA
jgi:uncharacterized integral membrane protein